MNKKENILKSNIEAADTATMTVTKNHNTQIIDEKSMEQFNTLVLGIGERFLISLNENIGDYKAISADANLSSVEKAIGKRKILLLDIFIGTATVSSILTLIWIAKKVF